MSTNKFLENFKKLAKIPSKKDVKATAAEKETLIEQSTVLEFFFAEAQLGLRLQNVPQSCPVVVDTVPGTEAHRLGVQPGDVLLELNGQRVKSAESFVSALQGLRRPITLKFERPTYKPAAATSTSSLGSSFKRAQDTARAKIEKARPAAPVPLTDAERSAQREAMLKAAEARGKAWDTKLQKSRSTAAAAAAAAAASTARSISPESRHSTQQQQHPETQRMVELCRTQEQKTADSLGYNPYEAKLTGVSEARQAVANATAPAAPSSDSQSALQQQQQQVQQQQVQQQQLALTEAEEESALQLIEEADDALMRVLSCGDAAASSAAVTTLNTLLTNMLTKREDKFRRVRLANKAIAAKVASVPGGLDVLLAAGFELHSDEEEAYLHYCEPWEPVSLRLRVTMHRLLLATQSLDI